MRPERWQQLDRIFEASLDRAPHERAAFLDEACGGGDRTLRREVELLLDSHEQAGSFIETPAVEEHAVLIASQTAQLRPGGSLDHYRIVGQRPDLPSRHDIPREGGKSGEGTAS